MQNPCVKLMDSDIISSIADGQLLLLFYFAFLTVGDIALRVRCCAECVHEGVKLLRIREKGSMFQ